MSAVFFVSLVIKLSLKAYQERLTFVNNIDDAKYHLTSWFMEIVEITEQYCYTMNIGISMTIYIYNIIIPVILIIYTYCIHTRTKQLSNE